MPTLLNERGFRFFFFSRELNEPSHIHVEKDDNYAKVWLEPIEIAKNYGFSAKEVNIILDITLDNVDLFRGKWYEYFNK